MHAVHPNDPLVKVCHVSTWVGGTTSRAKASATERNPLTADRESGRERLIRLLIAEDRRKFSQALSAALDEAGDAAITSTVSVAPYGVQAARRAQSRVRPHGSPAAVHRKPTRVLRIHLIPPRDSASFP